MLAYVGESHFHRGLDPGYVWGRVGDIGAEGSTAGFLRRGGGWGRAGGGREVVVVWDGAPWHRAGAVRRRGRA